jgi:hypothetical protein
MNASHSINTTLLTAAAAVLCSVLQFTGIDVLAAPHRAAAGVSVVQLPKVLITAQRSTMQVVQQLPQVVIIGHRDGPAPAVTAQARPIPAAT